MLNVRSHSSLLLVIMLPPPLIPALLNNKWILSVWWRSATSSRIRSCASSLACWADPDMALQPTLSQDIITHRPTAAFPPLFRCGSAKVRDGARGRVPAAEAERPLSVQSRDLRGDA